MEMLKKRRFSFPHPNLAAAQIEPIVQPLYSMAVIDDANFNTQREIFFFRYSVGQDISGVSGAAAAVSSTIINTNMDTAGFIASPKVFLATGTRFLISNLTAVLADALEVGTAGGAEITAPSMVTNFLEVIYGTYYRFFVGTKDYLTIPTWGVPCNTGVGGLASISLSGKATTGPDFSQANSLNTAGRYYSFGDHRILIPSQQNFFTSITAPHAAPPAITSELAVYSVLDGFFGREVQ